MTGAPRRRRAGASSAAPIPFVVLAALAVGFLALPLVGLLAQTPWRRLADELAAPQVRLALRSPSRPLEPIPMDARAQRRAGRGE